MTTQSYIIRVHSFVDLITNSSSEIFISADQKTVDTVREIVQNVLTLGGSTAKADDLFDFNLVVEDPDSYPTKTYVVGTAEATNILEEGSFGDNGATYSVQLTPKVDSKEAIALAKVLNNLTSLFTITESYS